MSENNDDDSREARFQKLRKQRQNQPGFEGARTGMQGLWAGIDQPDQPHQQAPEGGPSAPFLKNLLKNPKVRQMVAGWLAQNRGNEGLGAKTMGDMLGAEDYGLEQLGKEEKVTSSSTPDEIERYRKQLSNRADWLEAALEETLMELDRVSRFEGAAPEAPKTPEKKTASKKKTTKKKVAAKKTETQKPAPKKAVKKKAAARKTAPAPKTDDDNPEGGG